MALTARKIVRLVSAVTLVVFAFLMLASGPAAVATATSHDLAPCAPETTTCTQLPFPCATSCSVSAGPVTNLGQGQAAYIQVDNIPQGDEVGIGFCSLAGGSQVTPEPKCASSIPPQPGCTIFGSPCPNTSSPQEWVYGTVISSETLLSIGTDFDPNVTGANPIVSQTPAGIRQS